MLFISGRICGYGVISQDYFAFAASFPGLATGKPFGGSCAPDQPLGCVLVCTLFPSTLLLSGTARARAVLGSAISPRSPGSFYWEKKLEMKHWALGAYSYWGTVPFRAFRSQSKETRVFIVTHVCIHTSIKVSACNHVYLH